MGNSDTAHPKNAPGPFYVEYGCCTACDVPFAEAPELFEYDEQDHCYVKRQPTSKDEETRAIRAAWAAELQCIRYRGNDRTTLRRFAELGLAHLCDVTPPRGVKPVVRNHVAFDVRAGNASLGPRDLATAFRNHLTSRQEEHQELASFLEWRFTPLIEAADAASFSYAWFQNHFHKVEFIKTSSEGAGWLVRNSPVDTPAARAVSVQLDDWLKNDGRFSSVRWYSEEEWKQGRQGQEAPW